jgi:hypothetical protein
MRLRRRTWLAVSIATVITLAAFAWARFERGFTPQILWKGRIACGNRMPCVFTLKDVFGPGWDRLYVFDMAASQEEVNAAVGSQLRRPDLQRLMVFTRNSRVIRTITEPEEFEKPDRLSFDRLPQIQHHILIHPDDAFVLARGDADCDSCEVLSFIKPGEMVE